MLQYRAENGCQRLSKRPGRITSLTLERFGYFGDDPRQVEINFGSWLFSSSDFGVKLPWRLSSLRCFKLIGEGFRSERDGPYDDLDADEVSDDVDADEVSDDVDADLSDDVDADDAFHDQKVYLWGTTVLNRVIYFGPVF